MALRRIASMAQQQALSPLLIKLGCASPRTQAVPASRCLMQPCRAYAKATAGSSRWCLQSARCVPCASASPSSLRGDSPALYLPTHLSLFVNGFC